MLKQNASSKQALFRVPHILALFSIAALIIGLLITNYFTQHSLLLANTKGIEQNLRERGKSIEYFFSEREKEIRNLATSKVVTGFFSNRDLGMTMAYGLHTSLNNINRMFQRHTTNGSRLDGNPVYSHLYLLDINGDVLSSWPAIEMAENLPTPENISSDGVLVTSLSSGIVSFTAPVIVNDTIQGYLRGWVNYELLFDYLFGAPNGLLFLTDHSRLAFQTEPNVTILNKALRKLKKNETTWPFQIPYDELINTTALGHETPAGGMITLYYTNIAGYEIDLYFAEKSSTAARQQGAINIMIVLVALSIGVFMAAAMILRTGTKNLILQTSLVESEKREVAVAEKAEELQLIIDGAQLGTWNWDIITGKVRFNKRWQTMLGYEMGEVAPHVDSWKELVHPEDWATVMSTLQTHLDGKTATYSVEHRLRHKSGKWVWVLDTGKVLKRDSTGKPLHAFGIHLDLSKQKEAQQLLGKAKEESDAIIRNFLDTLIVVDRELTIARVNQATCQLLGYSEYELNGKPISLLFHDTDEVLKEVFTFYAAADAGKGRKEELRNVELCYRAKDGTRLPMSFNISLLYGDNGQITGVIAGAKDISKLKDAIDKVARQKEYIENLFDVVPEGLLAISPSMKIVKSNRVYNDIVQSWASRFGLSEEALTLELLGNLERTLPVQHNGTILVSHNHTTAFFKYSSTPTLAFEGVEYVVSLRDTTKERNAEAERKLLATIIEQTTDTVIITDPGGIIRYVNPAALENSGYREDELLGQKTSLFKSKETNPKVYDELWQTITQGNVWFGRLTSLKKDHTPIEEDVTISPVRDAEGDITHYVAIKRDVTEMDLLQRQLLQAQKMEAIGQLAAGIAHEINTPMQYVQNNVTFFQQAFYDIVGLLEDYKELHESSEIKIPPKAESRLTGVNLDFLLEEIPESIEEAHGGIDRVVKIVSAMKDFSHPGTDDKTVIDINKSLESTIMVSRNEWKYVAELKTDLDPNLPMVSCLPDQFNQAILNLIINAAHAVEEAGGSIPDNPGDISISSRYDDDTWVEIRISDSGNGIPEEIQDRIFDPFFTTKEVGKGTGQGLSIIHDVVVQKHDGRISFVTSPGEGTTFVIRLPIKPSGVYRETYE